MGMAEKRDIWMDSVGSPVHSCQTSSQDTALALAENPSLNPSLFESHEGESIPKLFCLGLALVTG